MALPSRSRLSFFVGRVGHGADPLDPRRGCGARWPGRTQSRRCDDRGVQGEAPGEHGAGARPRCTESPRRDRAPARSRRACRDGQVLPPASVSGPARWDDGMSMWPPDHRSACGAPVISQVTWFRLSGVGVRRMADSSR